MGTKTFHGWRLPMRTFLHAHGLCDTRYCPRCSFPDCHLFWQRPFVQALLDVNELRNSPSWNTLSYHSVLYQLFLGIPMFQAILEAWCLINCFKDTVACQKIPGHHLLREESVQERYRLVHNLLREYATMYCPDVNEEED